MKKLFILLTLLPSLLMAQTVWDGTTNTDWYTSNPSATEFTITTAEQLAGLAELVNENDVPFEGKTIYLGADIVLNDPTLHGGAANWRTNNTGLKQWEPIGSAIGPYLFSGTFDGNGHVISGLYIDNNEQGQGLFGLSTNVVKNLGLREIYIRASLVIGTMVAAGYGNISNFYCLSCNIVEDNMGFSTVLSGLTGSSSSPTISNSYFVGSINSSNGTARAGAWWWNSELLNTNPNGINITTAEMQSQYFTILLQTNAGKANENGGEYKGWVFNANGYPTHSNEEAIFSFVPVTGIEGLNIPEQVTLGTVIPLGNVKVLPSEATYQNIVWSASGAYYNNYNTGTIEFNQIGEAKITATIECGLVEAAVCTDYLNNYVQEWTVTVNAPVLTGSLWTANTDDFLSLQVQTPDAKDCWAVNPYDPYDYEYNNPCYLGTGGWWWSFTNHKVFGDVENVQVELEGAYVTFSDGISLTGEYGASLIGNSLKVKLDVDPGELTGAGIGFNHKNPNNRWDNSPTNTINIAGKGGYCLTYSLTGDPLQFELGWDESGYEDFVYDYWFATLEPGNNKTVNLPWSAFEQEGWSKVNGVPYPITRALEEAVSVKIHNGYNSNLGVNSEFELFELGWLGECGDGDVVEPVFVAVEDIQAPNIPEEVFIDINSPNPAIGFLPNVLPANATNKDIVWNVEGADYTNNGGQVIIGFSRLGEAKITATVTCGTSENKDGNACVDYTKSWTVTVKEKITQPVLSGLLWSPNTDDFLFLQVQTPDAKACWEDNPPDENGYSICLEETAGWWFGYTEPIGDVNTITEVELEGTYTDFRGGISISDEYGSSLIGDALKVRLTNGAPENPAVPTLAGIGFNFNSPESAENISGAEGYCLTYSSDNPVELELGWEPYTGNYDTWFAVLQPSNGFKTVNLPWSKFEKENWEKGEKDLPIEVAINEAWALRIRAKNETNTPVVTNFALKELGWHGSCGGGGVVEPVIAVTDIQASIPTEVTVGETIIVSAKVLPANATNKRMKWVMVHETESTNDTLQGYMNENGYASIEFPKEVGEAKIIISVDSSKAGNIYDWYGEFYRTWNVVVKEKTTEPVFVAVTGIEGVNIPKQVDDVTLPLLLNGASVLPIDATNKNIIWASTNAIITTNENGETEVMFNESAAIATITAIVKNGKIDSSGNKFDYVQTWYVVLNIEEIEPELFFAVSNIQVNIPTEVTVGDSIQLGNAKVQPANANNKEISWDAFGNAELNGNMVSFTGEGEATIIATVKCGLAQNEDGSVCQDYSKSWNVAVETIPVSGSEFIPVDTIIAYFPKFAARGDLILLGGESALPKNADNRNIVWSADGVVSVLESSNMISFVKGGKATITATIENGKANGEDYIQTWDISVSTPIEYTITVIADNLTLKEYSFEAEAQVTILANAAPAGKEFERWKVTSKNKPVMLNEVDLFSSILSLVMPKMDLEVTALYKTVALPPKYEVTVIGGSAGSDLYEIGENVSVTLDAAIPDGYDFGYWTVFPADALSVDVKEANISFIMPETDVMLRAVFSKRETSNEGKIIEISDIVKSSNIEDWVSTIIGESEIEVKKEEDGSIAITAKVSEDGFAAIETDVAMNGNTTNNDSVHVSYSSGNEWRLYLDIPGIPHSEGYFVILPANEEPQPAQPLMKAFSYSMAATFAGELSEGSKAFSLSDFTNELGESISIELSQRSTGMSFSPVTEGETEASLKLKGLEIASVIDEGNNDSSSSFGGGEGGDSSSSEGGISSGEVEVSSSSEGGISSSEVEISSSSEGGTPIISQVVVGNMQVQTIGNTIIMQNLPFNSIVEVYNLKGNRIYTGNTGNLSTLNTQVHAKGMYIIKATLGSEMQAVRVVVK